MADATSITMGLLWSKLLEKNFSDNPLTFPGLEVKHLERKIDAVAKVLGHGLPTVTTFGGNLKQEAQ